MSDAAKDKKILVVEDDESLRNLYVEILTQEGFQIESAADGETALNLMQKGGFDLVLLDIMLPKMGGVTILQKLSTDNIPQTPNKHIVILSNLGQMDTIANAMSLGAEGYLLKSDYTPDQIIERVYSFLGIK